MQRTQKYKNIERNAVATVFGGVRAFFCAIASLFARLLGLFTHKVTVMVVPHSQDKVVSFRTNVFAIFFAVFAVVAILFSFFYFNRHSVYSSVEINTLINENKQMMQTLDEIRDENATLLSAAKKFRSALGNSFSVLGIDYDNHDFSATGDLASLFNVSDVVAKGAVPVATKEISDIKGLTDYLNNSVDPIEQVGKMLENQSSLFKEIPNICPVKGNNLHISMTFGPNTHPFTGQWYIHKGVDFSTFRSGDIVMATANGQVVSCGYDSVFGNSVVIRHKHGIYTRFAHLARFIIKKGDYVTQGQTIGYIGNTGITTGAHLHYEVHIGSDVVDPTKYVNARFGK